MKSIEIKGTVRTDVGKKATHELRKTMVFLVYCMECRKTKTACP